MGGGTMSEPEIYCPSCGWRPRSEDRWSCMPSCGTVWNTFWTGGVCPGCKYPWEKTQCLACGELSLHRDWYHYPEGESHRTDRERTTTA
jgi:hypothetical protein